MFSPRQWPSLASFLVSFLSFSLLLNTQAMAQKVNFEMGGFSINAEPPVNSGAPSVQLGGFGAFSASANFELKQPLEIGVGYTVFYSKTLSGDMGFGPDFYLYYFPYGEGSGLKFENQQIQYREIQQWRPFIFAAFHQRQFQSVQSAFSGFGVGLGTEYQWEKEISLRSTVRTMSLTGPSTAKFTYMDFLIGLQFQF